MSKSFTIILDQTSHPGNIGAAARAMKTMGIEDLRLVNTTSAQHPDAYAMASGADDILFHAKLYDKLTPALDDIELLFGLSARKRSQYRHCIYSHELGDILAKHPQHNKIGFLFGNEQSGLDNTALSYCQYQVLVPTNPKFSSLNLAACVQLISYICHTTQLTKNDAVTTMKPPIAQGQYLAMVEMLHSIIKNTNMHNEQLASQTEQRLRQIVLHSGLNQTEIDLIMGILKQLSVLSTPKN